MSRWFRHYAGMMRDEKLVRVAVQSKQSIERVLWIWGAILESAAEVQDNGRFDIDPSEVAYFLRCDDADVRAVQASLESVGRIADGVVMRWNDRQFESDNSRERQRRYRDRRKQDRDRHGDDPTPSRDGEVTLQETETDTDTLEASASKAAEPAAPDPVLPERDLFVRGKQVLGKNAGGLIADLLRTKGGNCALARASIEEASQRENAREFIGGIINKAKNAGGSNGLGKTQTPHAVAIGLERWARDEDERELLTHHRGRAN